VEGLVLELGLGALLGQRDHLVGELLVAVHDAGHAQQHEREHHPRGAHQHVQIEGLAQGVAQDDQQRHGEARAGQQRQPRPRELPVRFRAGRGQQAHRGMQGGGAEQHVVDGPAREHDAVHAAEAAQQLPPVQGVAEQQHDGTGQQEREGRLAAVAAGGDAGDHTEHEDVHRRVGHRGEPAEQRQRVPVDVGRDQIHPQQRRQRQRHDQRVDQARPVAVLAAFADEQHHAGDEERVEGQVEGVGERRERERRAEQPFVVVGEHVTGDEQPLPDRQQVPRRAAAGVPARADDQRAHARAADQVEHQPAPQPGGPGRLRERVGAAQQSTGGEVHPPGAPRERALPVDGAYAGACSGLMGAGVSGGGGHGITRHQRWSTARRAPSGSRWRAALGAAAGAPRERGAGRSAASGGSRSQDLHGRTGHWGATKREN
jgi:hypothetical protein